MSYSSESQRLNTQSYPKKHDEFNLDEIHSDLERFQQDEFVKTALSSGVDLRQYARKLDTDISALVESSLDEYEEAAPDIAKLYKEVVGCDEMLAKMENLLQHFQEDLGEISDEIKTLQDESIHLNVKLKNRKAIKG